ncbi:MAG: hypothetical protein AAB316_09700 [Bacteroidota bacterium]
MNHGIIILPAAESDMVNAFLWYRKQSPGLEWKYWDAILETFIRIQKYPTHFTPVSADVRMAFAKRFPYKIIFNHNQLMQRVEIIFTPK